MTDVDAALIDAAEQVVAPHLVASGHLCGDVGAALITEAGNRYRGVCLDTASGTGFCAEASAIAAMVTAGEYRVARIVAVARDDEGRLLVLPPCGRCREFIRQVDPANLDTQVVLGWDRAVPLRLLLPETDWPEPLPGRPAGPDRSGAGG